MLPFVHTIKKQAMPSQSVNSAYRQFGQKERWKPGVAAMVPIRPAIP